MTSVKCTACQSLRNVGRESSLSGGAELVYARAVYRTVRYGTVRYGTQKRLRALVKLLSVLSVSVHAWCTS